MSKLAWTLGQPAHASIFGHGTVFLQCRYRSIHFGHIALLTVDTGDCYRHHILLLHGTYFTNMRHALTRCFNFNGIAVPTLCNRIDSRKSLLRYVHELELAHGDGDSVAKFTFPDAHAHKEAP